MVAQCGAGVVVSVKDGSGSYQVLAGLRTRKLTFNSAMVDVTSADSVGRWRELLDSCGVRSAALAGDGVFLDDTGIEAARDMMFNNSIRVCSMLFPGFGTFVASFKLTQMDVSATYNGEVAYTLAFESAGAVTFTGQ